MTDLREQLREYADHVDRTQQPVTMHEVLRHVEPVRIPHTEPRPTEPGTNRRNVFILLGAAAAFIVVLASPFVFGRWIEEGSPSDQVTQTSTTSTTVIEVDAATISTHLGLWTWAPSDRLIDNSVRAYRGQFWSADSDLWHAPNGPVDPTDRNPENWLLLSHDGITWEQSRLPMEMDGYAVSLLSSGVASDDDLLTIVGVADPSGWDRKVWTSQDGLTWSEQPWSSLPFGGDSAVEIPGLDPGSFMMRFGSDDPQEHDGVQLMSSWVFFEPLSEALDLIGNATSMSESVQVGGSGRTAVVHNDETSERFEIVTEVDGARLSWALYRDRQGAAAPLFATEVRFPNENLARIALDSGPVGFGVPLLLRDDGSGWQLLDSPFAGPEGTDSRSGQVVALTTSEDGFIAYGLVSGGETTRINDFVVRNESSTVGAVATSSDGIQWDVVTIEDLVEPQNVVTNETVTLWGGMHGYWRSEDGVVGDVREYDSAEPWGIRRFGDLFLQEINSGFSISDDGQTWSQIRWPAGYSNSWGYFTEDHHVFYGDGKRTWVGSLEP